MTLQEALQEALRLSTVLPTKAEVGDPAYTQYWGHEWTGKMVMVHDTDRPNAVRFEKRPIGGQPHADNVIWCSGKPVWDRERAMWRCEADDD